MKITGELQGWKYDILWNVVWGFIFNDVNGRFVDGTWIHTSNIPDGRLNHLNFKEGDVVQTLNSTYQLGAPHSEWGNPDDITS